MSATGLRRGLSREAPFFAANKVDGASFVVGACVSHVTPCAIQLLDPDGHALRYSGSVDCYLATLATGLVLSSAPGGGVLIGTNGMLITITTNLAWKAISNTSGMFDINVTNNGVASYYLILVMPTGVIVASPVITTA